MAALESYNDPRIRLIAQANQGVSAARNHGIDASKGEVIAILDADDRWHPDHLETIDALVKAHPHGGVYSTGLRMEYEDGSGCLEVWVDTGDRGSMEVPVPFKMWSTGNNVSIPSNSAVRREVLQEAGPFRVGELENEDNLLGWVHRYASFAPASARLTASPADEANSRQCTQAKLARQLPHGSSPRDSNGATPSNLPCPDFRPDDRCAHRVRQPCGSPGSGSTRTPRSMMGTGDCSLACTHQWPP